MLRPAGADGRYRSMREHVKRTGICLLGLALSMARPAWAQCGGDDCLEATFNIRGTVDFFATGGSLTFNDDDDDRPDGTLELGQVRVERRVLPPRAELVRAFLYFGGSLYADGDGREDPDTEVELQVPGSAEFVPVVGDVVLRSGPIQGFPELSLYSVRADVTDLVPVAKFDGTYRIRGFDADIFNGTQEHTAANASFSLVLIYQEPRLPPRDVVLFDGLQTVLGSTVALDLAGFVVSELPSGSLTVYALEGDCNPGPDACDRGDNASGLERIRVIGADGTRQKVLSGPDNPANDLFNRTINTVDPPLRNVVGTDIDAFDISDVLRTGDQEVRVEVTTPRPSGGSSGELVGLVYVVVGIDVFAPELDVDSRIEVANELGDSTEFFPGDPLRVTFAVSNTGNISAQGARVDAVLPDLITDFVVLPGTASVAVDGRTLAATGVDVNAGEVQGVNLLVETACPLPDGGLLTLTATISGSGVTPFVVTATAALQGRDRCGPRFFLFGGGGCRAQGPMDSSVPWLVLLGLLAVVAWRFNESRAWAWIVLALLGGCGEDAPRTDRPSPAPLGLECPDRPDMVVIPSIRNQPPFCIDPYEARAVDGELGDPVQPEGGNGSTTALAVSDRFVMPTRALTWHQAAAACRNAGKRLCSAEEWRTACGGDDARTYPYGDAFEPGRCNGFEAGRLDAVQTGAMIVAREADDGRLVADGCVSQHGVYDISGNLWEWNADPFFDGRTRGVAGGSFRSNAIGLRCVTDDTNAEPAEQNDAYGFRCCYDLFP